MPEMTAAWLNRPTDRPVPSQIRQFQLRQIWLCRADPAAAADAEPALNRTRAEDAPIESQPGQATLTGGRQAMSALVEPATARPQREATAGRTSALQSVQPLVPAGIRLDHASDVIGDSRGLRIGLERQTSRGHFASEYKDVVDNHLFARRQNAKPIRTLRRGCDIFIS